VLEYIDQETSAMDDPSGFTCIMGSQTIIPIVDKISINVPDTSLSECSFLLDTTTLFFNKYVIFLDKAQFLHGVTRRYRYKSAYAAASTSRMVSSVECNISPSMFDVKAIQNSSLWFYILSLTPILQTSNMCLNSLKKTYMFE
jgi:hypothetical protein